MSHQSSLAIVLRTIEFSETSLVVTLLTRELGRVSALAKGARRLKGPFEGALDLLSVCRIELISKSGDVLDLLTESKLRRRFRGGERSLLRTYAGFHIAESLRLLIDDDDPHPALFDLTLWALGEIDGEGPVAATLLVFDCQCLRLLGHAMSTDRCTTCDVKLELTNSTVPISLEGGGVVCQACRSRAGSVSLLDSYALDILRRCFSSPNEQSPQSVDQLQAHAASLLPQIDQTSYAILRGTLNRYQQTLLGRIPRMQAYLPTRLEQQ